MKTDVAVIGGGAIGAAIAYFLRTHPRPCEVAVVERDPAFRLASTPRASGGIRQLFSLPENILLSKFGLEFFADFEHAMAVDGEPAPIGFTRGGYLFIVPPAAIPVLQANFEVQQRHGVDVRWLDPAGLKAQFPSMYVDDLGAGVHSPTDGWLDPSSVLQGLRRKARAVGAQLVTGEVAAIECEGKRVRRLKLRSGETIEADHVINAAGAWAKEIAAMVGLTVPIEPMRRYEHYFEPATPIERLPYVKDVNRLAFRPEGKGYTGGVPDLAEPRGFNFEVDHDYFERVVWPAVAHRFPPLETLKLKNTMPGLYDQNELDGNPILGPSGLENFHLAAGFSGHGLMHAPGIGRAFAELILDGGYRTIDLARFGWQRVVDNKPCRERGIL